MPTTITALEMGLEISNPDQETQELVCSFCQRNPITDQNLYQSVSNRCTDTSKQLALMLLCLR